MKQKEYVNKTGFYGKNIIIFVICLLSVFSLILNCCLFSRYRNEENKQTKAFMKELYTVVDDVKLSLEALEKGSDNLDEKKVLIVSVLDL